MFPFTVEVYSRKTKSWEIVDGGRFTTRQQATDYIEHMLNITAYLVLAGYDIPTESDYRVI